MVGATVKGMVALIHLAVPCLRRWTGESSTKRVERANPLFWWLSDTTNKGPLQQNSSSQRNRSRSDGGVELDNSVDSHQDDRGAQPFNVRYNPHHHFSNTRHHGQRGPGVPLCRFFRMVPESASIESQFSTVPMCMFRFGLMIQVNIISCFVANGNICDERAATGQTEKPRLPQGNRGFLFTSLARAHHA
jgi:hypothetical protein